MDAFLTIICIIIAARLISWPVAAFLPIGGNLLFLCLIGIGAWHIFSSLAAILGTAAVLGFFYSLGAPDLPSNKS